MTQSNIEVYYSKRDWWATIIVWTIITICWAAGIYLIFISLSQGVEIFSGLVSLLAGLGSLWFWSSTRYKLLDHSLKLISGPFFKTIYYSNIKGVRDGRKTNGLSFAFSRDCLQIDVEGSKLGFRISPEEQYGFLSALANKCNHLILRRQELVLKNK